MSRPFVKWAGGKDRLKSQITMLLPPRINRYFEPFLGGGAVLLEVLQQERAEMCIGRDINSDLVQTWNAVCFRTLPLMRELVALQDAYNEAGDPALLFYEWREEINDFGNRPELTEIGGLAKTSARFIALNKTCFNGLYRVNRDGKFNAPHGAYKRPRDFTSSVRAVSNLIQGKRVAFEHRDFLEDPPSWHGQPGTGDAVYYDPPYDPVSETANFTSYSVGGFGKPEQEKLAERAHKLWDRGAHVVASNADTPFIRKLWKGFEIHEVRVGRRINCKGGKRGAVGELLMVGRP